MPHEPSGSSTAWVGGGFSTKPPPPGGSPPRSGARVGHQLVDQPCVVTGVLGDAPEGDVRVPQRLRSQVDARTADLPVLQSRHVVLLVELAIDVVARVADG